MEPLIMALQEKSIRVRSHAASILGEIKDARAVVPLIEALRGQSWVLRSEGRPVPRKIKDPRAIVPLREMLSDKDAFVREIADGALFEIERQ